MGERMSRRSLRTVYRTFLHLDFVFSSYHWWFFDHFICLNFIRGYTETFRIQANSDLGGNFNLLKFTKFKGPRGQNGVNWKALIVIEVCIFFCSEKEDLEILEIYSSSLKIGQVFEKVPKHSAF